MGDEPKLILVLERTTPIAINYVQRNLLNWNRVKSNQPQETGTGFDFLESSTFRLTLL